MKCFSPNGTPARLHMIGLEHEELRWLRTLTWLLRHPDPAVPELARQALLYLGGMAERREITPTCGDDAHTLKPDLVS